MPICTRYTLADLTPKYFTFSRKDPPNLLFEIIFSLIIFSVVLIIFVRVHGLSGSFMRKLSALLTYMHMHMSHVKHVHVHVTSTALTSTALT